MCYRFLMTEKDETETGVKRRTSPKKYKNKRKSDHFAVNNKKMRIVMPVSPTIGGECIMYAGRSSGRPAFVR